MSTTEIKAPFIKIGDIDGEPLKNGSVYIGEAGKDAETFPISVFWDSGLSVPALQPIQTLNGYLSRSGVPANIYCEDDDYSITVRNKNGSLVYSSLSVEISTSASQTMYTYAVSQLANGDKSTVSIMSQGLDVSLIDWLIYPNDGRIYYSGGVTGEMAGDFSPDTGVDTGLSKALTKFDITSENTINEISKTEKYTRALELDGSDIKAKQDFSATINGIMFKIVKGTTAPPVTLVSSTDYKVYGLSDSTLLVQEFDTESPDNSCLIGGFHAYHTTATCNPNSIWDMGYRPTCEPRGMTKSLLSPLWVDGYNADADYTLFNYSRGDQVISTGTNPPVKPSIFGGDGVTKFTGLTWFVANRLALSAGKRLPSWAEFSGFAYGVVEATSNGTDPVTTKYIPSFRSSCGVEMATGCINIWGSDTQGSGTGWSSITGGFGSVYASSLSGVRLGGDYLELSNSGSFCANWNNALNNSTALIGCRFVCDHIIL